MTDTLHYWAARTTVTVSGTVTVKCDHDGKVTAERVIEVGIGVGSDPDGRHDVQLKDGWESDSDFELTLADDGRLAGAGYNTTGIGPQLVGAAVRVVTLAATLAEAALGSMAAPDTPPTRATVDGSEAKRQEQVTQLRTRQRALLERIDLLQRASSTSYRLPRKSLFRPMSTRSSRACKLP